MAEVKAEEIAGIYIDGSLCCPECLNSKSGDNYGLDDILTVDQVEGDVGEKEYFCDACKKRL